MAKRLAISIGVSKAGHLPALPGALRGACEFAGWAEATGFETTLITDEKGPVSVTALRDALRLMLDDDVERLLLYFAGHGTANSSSDLWLLSGWEDDGNEVVNVALTLNHAKRQHIPKIAVFADACRSVVPQIAYLGGANIFPKVSVPAPRSPQWDMFLATRLSEAAQEAGGGHPTRSYGVFTKQLMSALNADEMDAFVQAGDGTEKVTSPSLADWLENAVPLASGMIPGAITQYPDISVAWRPPDNFYVSRLASDAIATSPPRGSTRGRNSRENTLPTITEGRIALQRSALQEIMHRLEASMYAPPPFTGFHSSMGLSVYGAEVMEAVAAKDIQTKILSSGAGVHVEFDGEDPCSAVLRLADGRWAAAVVIPGYVGILAFERGTYAGLSYVALGVGAADAQRAREAYLIAKLAAAIGHGGNTLLRRDRALLLGPDVLDALREPNRSPTSIVLAAYVLERQGRLDLVREFMAQQDRLDAPVAFDVPLLVGWQGEASLLRPCNFVGGFPLMTAGWAYIDDDTPSNETLRSLREHLVPGLWTTFDAKGGPKVAKLIERGLL